MTSFSGLRTNALSFRYKKNCTILHQINTELKRGKITALLGDNGSGKTTFLKIIAGIMKPSTGKFFFNDLEINANHLELYKKKIGYMPEFLQLYPDMRPFEVLEFFNKLRHGKPERIYEVLDRVDLIKHKDKKISAFSKGMKQRLNLAQAILANPEILILDEPSNGFDASSVKTFYEIIREFANQNALVILSNHQFTELGDHADEVLVLAKGVIQTQVSIAEFIGSSKGNKKHLYLYFDANTPEEKIVAFLKEHPDCRNSSEKSFMIDLESNQISRFIAHLTQLGLYPSNVRVEGNELQALLETI